MTFPITGIAGYVGARVSRPNASNHMCQFSPGSFVAAFARANSKPFALRLDHNMHHKPLATSAGGLELWIDGERILFNAEVDDDTELGRLTAYGVDKGGVFRGVSLGLRLDKFSHSDFTSAATGKRRTVIGCHAVELLRELTLCSRNEPAFAGTFVKRGHTRIPSRIPTYDRCGYIGNRRGGLTDELNALHSQAIRAKQRLLRGEITEESLPFGVRVYRSKVRRGEIDHAAALSGRYNSHQRAATKELTR